MAVESVVNSDCAGGESRDVFEISIRYVADLSMFSHSMVTVAVFVSL